jgi:hypothetical protein
VAAGFRHATNTPRTPFPRSQEKVSQADPIAKFDRKDLIGKKMYDQQANFLGKIVGVTKENTGEIVIPSTTRDGNQRSSRFSEQLMCGGKRCCVTCSATLDWVLRQGAMIF